MDEGDETLITVELSDGSKLAVRAEQMGPVLASKEDLVATFEKVTHSIETVGRDVMEAVKRISPDRASVELGFGLALEAGQLVALFGRGRGEATIKVTLEWARAATTQE